MKQERPRVGDQGSDLIWTQRLREKLADHEVAAPADLWAGIEAKLAQRQAPKQATKQRAHVVPLWGRWAAAAAVVAGILLGAGYRMLQSENTVLTADNRNGKVPEQVDRMAAEQHSGAASVDSDAILDAGTVSRISQGLMARAENADGVVATVQEAVSELIHTREAVEEQPSVRHSSDGQPSEEKPSGETTVTRQKALPDQEDAIRQLDEKIAREMRRSPSRVGLGLYAANSFGSQMNSNGVVMNPVMAANYSQNNYMSAGTRGDGTDVIYLAGYEESQKHYQPVSFGLTTNIPLAPRLQLATGLVYTRLRSDFTSKTPAGDHLREQTLHYIGVPVSLQYMLWQYSGLRLYASAGGQIDINVAVKAKSDGIDLKDQDRDRLQFSAQAGLGVQYNFIPLMGIYVEPGVKYYFDNGSDVRNFFKDKRTNFNLQVGLRFNLAN